MYHVFALGILLATFLIPKDAESATVTYTFRSILTNAEWTDRTNLCKDDRYLNYSKCMNQNFTDDFSGITGDGHLEFDMSTNNITECTTGFSNYFNSCSGRYNYVNSFNPVTGELHFHVTDFVSYVKDVRISPLGGRFSYMDDDEPFSLLGALSFFDVSADLPPPPAVPLPASGALLLSILPLAGLWRARRRKRCAAVADAPPEA